MLVKRLLFYVFLIASVIIVSSSISVYLYKDRIIQRFIVEMNQTINTPVHVDHIDISLWSHFPFISIDLNDIVVEESYQWSSAPLLTAQKVALSFHPIQLLKGNYTVEQLHVTNAQLDIRIDRSGVNNYTIFKDNEEKSPSSFNISKATMDQVAMTYNDQFTDKGLHFSTQQLAASLDIINDVYNIAAKGDVESHQVQLHGKSYFKNKALTTTAAFKYNRRTKKITIASSSIEAFNSNFIIQGDYDINNGEVDLSLRNDQTNLKTIIALIPERYTVGLKKYNSAGEGYFELKLNGRFAQGKFPAIQIDFGMSNASIFHPNSTSKLDSVFLIGKYSSPDFSDLSTTALSLNKVAGKLGNQHIKASLAINNFNHPFIDLSLKGNLEMEQLLNFYPESGIEEAAGLVSTNLTLQGNINDLKHKSTVNKVKSSGEFTLQKVKFVHKASNMPFHELTGSLKVDNNNLALNNFSGMIGSSDFQLTGVFKNFAAYVLLENQPLGIEADLAANLIDLDELLSNNFSTTTSNQGNYSFSIPANLQLKFNCNIEQLKFRRFLGNTIKGDLQVKDQVVASNNISVETMDGQLSIAGSADASSDSVFVYSEVTFTTIALDQLFFVFENFNQNFLMDTHLKGAVNAEITAFLAFDKNLNFNTKEMLGDISTTISGGELNNFEPMQQLSDYLDGEELSALRFAELENDIHIEKGTIYIPTMEINSNATNITIGGTHTFDQNINYSVVAPLNNRKKIDADAAFGAIEEDDAGNMKVFLKITGTTDDYKVSYDQRALKKNIINNMKKEVKELKDAFRNKGKKEKIEVVLEDDDYFDW